MAAAAEQTQEWEYVVVGSGAGGGTVAARLAEAGHTVLVLEAGGDPLTMQGGDALAPDRLKDDYEVPAFHAFSVENTALSWQYFVRHYTSESAQSKDPKYTKAEKGVFYPRVGALGGCTAHNAMIMVYPHNEDWDHIAQITGDPSWSGANMRKYFERLENCNHRFFLYRWLAAIGLNFTRHGWKGWLHTEKSIPKTALEDEDLLETIAKSAREALKKEGQPAKNLLWLSEGQGDPNDWRLVRDRAVGLRYAPLSTRNHARMGTRERLLDVSRRYPDRLKIELNALATRVLFDANLRATGVEYLKGERLYQAHVSPNKKRGEPRQARATREVILAGGAFNTPQLLMLSGVGPASILRKHGIPVRVDLPGVGSNLQDRYEVGLVHRMKFPEWKVLAGAKFAKGDPQYEEWADKRGGVYATNGAVLAVIKRSDRKRILPDLFCFSLLGNFPGYYPGFSKLITKTNYLTWAVLKAHTNNTGGRVTLRSADPRERPEINFHYFDEGTDESGADLDAVVNGIRFVRSMTADIADLVDEEELPGKHVQTPEELRAYVKSHAWGHHASCTCPIGPRTANGVLNGNFEVHGTHGLRVVDASVFPKIPGFFIVSCVYMIGEKAADVILKKIGPRH